MDAEVGEHCEGNPYAPSSLLKYVSHIVEALHPKDVDTLKAQHSERTLNIGELCAGMATGTIASKFLESKIMEIHGLPVACQTMFYSEMVAWKRALCQAVHERCGSLGVGAAAAFKERTADLIGLKDVKLDLLIGAIECDDVSQMSTTPRSILDRSGRSGSSFMEMIDFLSSCGMQQRPRFTVLECVASLDKHRSSVNEKGTTVVIDKMAELGYVGGWKTVNTRDFGIPQSRTRAYAVFVLRTQGFGDLGQQWHCKQIQRIWDFVEGCQLQKPDVLSKFLADAKFKQDDEMLPAKSSKKQKDNKKSNKKTPKWVVQRKSFKAKWNIKASEMDSMPQQALKQQQQKLGLTDREVDCAMLKLALQLRDTAKHPLDINCIVGNIGDSIEYLRFSSSLHPCILPQKKFLYIYKGQCYVNKNVTGNLYLSLQGIGQEEVVKAGLDGLDQRKSQELAGNAFTSHIVAAIVLGILVHWK